MKMSASLEFVWQMAGQEAVASQLDEIAPEHFLASILKFAELDARRLAECVSEPGKAEGLARDVLAVRGALDRRCIDGPAVRSRLQAERRGGQGGFPGGAIHRSAHSRALFDAAVRLAQNGGCDIVAPVHLLDALLATPTEAVARVLGGPGAAAGATPPDASHSQDREVQAGRERNVSAICAVEAKALIHALAHPSHKSVILLTEDDAVVPEIVAQAGGILAGRDCPASLKGTRIVDLSGLVSDGELSRALADAAGERSVLLYLPPAEMMARAGKSSQWVQSLETSIEAKSVRCIWRAAPATYEDMVNRSTTWKRRLRPIWVRPGDIREIPREL